MERLSQSRRAAAALPESAQQEASNLLRALNEAGTPDVDRDTAEALRSLAEWSDPSNVVAALKAIALRLGKEAPLSMSSVRRWIEAHDHDDVPSLQECLDVLPPPEVTVHKLLPRTGSQKLVFSATWNLTQSAVVLKRFIQSEKDLVTRELHPHPLSMVHPNIIETHLLRNTKGQEFLVERKLPTILGDHWRASGLEEASNLFRDLLEALVFLRREELVHGDIKPDNIGKEESRFILLDFGICRRASALGPDATPTGSLRTRAPELLAGHCHSYASDLWALGATVFNAIVGRFPLFESNTERAPRVSTPEPRREFEQLLLGRVRDAWNGFVTRPLNEKVQDSELVPILRSILAQDPASRPPVADALKAVEDKLGPFLLTHSERRGRGALSARETNELLQFYKDNVRTVRLMPLPELYRLRDRLRDTKPVGLPANGDSLLAELRNNVEQALLEISSV
jgi:serine/threonine protein kinase